MDNSTAEQIRKSFKNEKGISWVNSQGEPDFEYVDWLEGKLIATQSTHPVKEGLRWVKGIDMPIKSEVYFYRELNEDGRYTKAACFFDIDYKTYTDYDRHDAIRLDPTKIEWLDESPTAPAPVPLSEQGGVMEIRFANFIVNNRFHYDFDKERYIAAWDNYKEYTAEELYKEWTTNPYWSKTTESPTVQPKPLQGDGEIEKLAKELLLYCEKDGWVVNGFRTREIINKIQVLSQSKEGENTSK